MGVLHVLNCMALCFGPHVVYFQATQLSEYDTLKSIVHGGMCGVASTFIKTILLATFATAGETAFLSNLKDFVYVAVCLVDIILMWAALNRNPNKHISNEHKFQGVGLGWAVGDSICKRLFPIILGAKNADFTTAYLIQSLESNFYLIFSISFAAAASLLWGKKAKTSPLLPVLRLNMLMHALVPGVFSVLHHHEMADEKVLAGGHLLFSVFVAFCSYLLYTGMSRSKSE